MDSLPVAPVQAGQPSPGMGQGAPWRAAGAQVRGVSHERSGTPCQDAQAWRLLADGTLLVALADGAGSARFSDQGARCAVETALNALAVGFGSSGKDGQSAWDRLVREAFSAAQNALQNLTAKGEDYAAPREYACTLTCVVAATDWVAAGQLGDGAVIAEDSMGSLFSLTRLQRGEYANETHFLVEEDALEQMATVKVDRPVTGLAVMSDGLLRLALKMPAQEPHPPFFEPLFRFLRSAGETEGAEAQLAAFLSSERVNARTDDDKSLVLAVREQPRSSQPAAAAAGSLDRDAA